MSEPVCGTLHSVRSRLKEPSPIHSLALCCGLEFSKLRLSCFSWRRNITSAFRQTNPAIIQRHYTFVGVHMAEWLTLLHQSKTVVSSNPSKLRTCCPRYHREDIQTPVSSSLGSYHHSDLPLILRSDGSAFIVVSIHMHLG